MEKTDLIASFADALVSQGSTAVPNLLLRSYAHMGITDREMMLILQLLFLRHAEGDCFPSVKRLSEIMHADTGAIEEDMASLIEKKVVTVEKRINRSTLEVEQFYSLQGLFDKLAEVWALEKAREIELNNELNKKLAQRAQQEKLVSENGEDAAYIHQVFEKEFGRLFTPMETELIVEWCRVYPAELILEALRIAVLHGVLRLRYVERILQDWNRKNIRTLDEVRRVEEAFIEMKVEMKEKQLRRGQAGEETFRRFSG